MTALGEAPVNGFSDRGSTPLASTKYEIKEILKRLDSNI